MVCQVVDTQHGALAAVSQGHAAAELRGGPERRVPDSGRRRSDGGERRVDRQDFLLRGEDYSYVTAGHFYCTCVVFVDIARMVFSVEDMR